MTKAQNREEWVKAWTREIKVLYGLYQGKADPALFVKLDNQIKDLIKLTEEIGDKLDKEETWTNEPNL